MNNVITQKLATTKAKISFAFAAALTFIMLHSVGASAATGTTAITDSITSEFGSIRDMSLIALASIAGIAIVLFAGIYAWRYGKKVFQIIAK